MTVAFPLQWPEGWPRTAANSRSDSARFKSGSAFVVDATSSTGHRYVGTKPVSFDRARKLLFEELERMKVASVVLSSNVPLRLDGLPRADAARMRMDDPGVAVYFQHRKKPMVMAQDAFDTVAGNMRSLGLAVEALRQLERHGGGHMMERAFSGFAALPLSTPPWREVFGVPPEWRGDLRATFIRLSRERHPDAGGSQGAMSELNVAYEAAKRELWPAA